MKTFEELGVCEEIRKAIAEMGFETPMPIQEQVIPYLLGEGNDVIGLAQTGTGKTAAFGIPLLQKINRESHDTQAVVLCPTRELCLQITDDIKEFSKYMTGLNIVPVYGGTSIEAQIRALKHGAQIIVATPGRLIDLMNRGKANLENVRNVVLDEADEMLDMGFSESIDEILKGVPTDRNTLLFSATMSKEIEKIAKTYLHDAKEIVVGSRNEGAENVNHIYYMVNAKEKYLALKRIVDYHPRIYAIIFCRTKMETQEIADKLIRDGYNAESLHGDLSQQQRDLTMQKFRQHLTQLLVATDVAARGLDVDDLTHVINYGMPDDVENYTHRSGRTGRAGKKGTSIAIVHTREKNKIRAAEKAIGKRFEAGIMPSPQEICKKQLFKVMDIILKTDVDEEQIAPFMTDISRYFEYIDKEDILKKIVSLQFGKFLAYYANAPEIDIVTKEEKKNGERRERDGRKDRKRGGERSVEAGYKRMFINLGKADGFYPAEVMQLLNKHIKGRQEVGHIELLNRFSYFDVPEEDTQRVSNALSGVVYKGREVRCNEADRLAPADDNEHRGDRTAQRDTRRQYGANADNRYGNPDAGTREKRTARRRGDGSRFAPDFSKPLRQERYRGGHDVEGRRTQTNRGTRTETHTADGKRDDWRQFFRNDNIRLVGEEPDFSEEGWARRKPKKK